MTFLPSPVLAANDATFRHTIMQNRVERMVAKEGYFGTIFAPSGLGKTFCAKHLYRLLLDNDIHENHIIFSECIETDNGYIALEKLEKIVEQDLKLGAFAGVKSFFSGGVGKNIWAIVRGVAKDIAVKYNLKNTTDAVTDAIGGTIVDIPSKQNSGERLAERLVDLRERIARSERRYYLVIDGVEKMADPGLRFLTELSRRPIPNVRTIIFVEKGWQTKGSRQLRELKASLQSNQADQISELCGLSRAEIQGWYMAVHHKELSRQDAEKVIADSDGGSPCIVKAWLESGSDDINRTADHGRTAWGKMMLRLDALSAAESKVLQLLACAHPYALPPRDIATLAGISQHELVGTIATLRSLQDLIEDTSVGLRCAGRNLAECIKNNLGDSSVKFYRALVLDASLGSGGKHRALPVHIMENLSQSLLAANRNDANAINSVLDSVESSLENGASRLAETILASVESLPDNALTQWSISNRVRQARLRADLAGQFGDYALAIQWAKQGLLADPDPQNVIALKLSIGDKFLQIGHQTVAREYFRDARREAATSHDVNQYVVALVRTVKALFDIGRYDSCARLMKFLEHFIIDREIAEKTRCLCERWLARVYVRSNEFGPVALSHAQSALMLATKLEQGRQVGNCRFVLGEVYRSNGVLNHALTEFRTALNFARDSNNKDLEIYSLLGLVLTHAQSGDWFKFESDLGELKMCLTFSAPTEEIYVRLLAEFGEAHRRDSLDDLVLSDLVAGLKAIHKEALAEWVLSVKARSGSAAEKIAAQDWRAFIL